MSGDVVHRFPADFKKVPGQLTLTSTHVAWNPNVPGTMDRQSQAMSRVTNMLASKAGAAKVSLKLVFKDDVPTGGLHFVFSNPAASQREEDRKVVQDTLIPFVSANRTGGAPAPTPTAGPSTGGAASTPPSGSTPDTPSAVALGKRKAMDDGAAPSPGASSGAAPSKARTELIKLRIKVLKKNPNLEALHRELVRGKQITESEFWEGRENLIKAEEMAQAQKPGRQPRLIDDRFGLSDAKRGSAGVGGTGVGVKTKADTGPQMLSLTKEDIAQIFEEFPVVQDAYARHVPGISEAEFWSRYFQSQLWERHRASERTMANDELNKRKDDIFDQYLEDPDWNIQPRQGQPDNVQRFLDLSATEEDHGETSTQRDITMQAGREKGALPLIRRFNANAARLAHREEPSTAEITSVMPGDINIYDEIDLEDLHGPAASSTIELDVQDGQDKGDGTANGNGRAIIPGKTNEELVELAHRHSSTVQGYSPAFETVSLTAPPGGWEKNRVESGGSAEQARNYARFQQQKLCGEAASLVVKEMHLASNAENAASVPFPVNLLDQMKSCHNAATEFLRQYWSAILPLPPGAMGGPSATPAARAGKAEKMAGYLRLTEGKVEAVVHTATIEGVDPMRVRAALAPTLGAVNVALQREARRLAATAPTGATGASSGTGNGR